jgi:hypothetical protein
MVSVPVVVRDNRGHSIGAYTKENFQVFDRGKPQEILRFVVEKAGDQAAKAARTVDTLPVEGDAAQAKQPDVPERFVAYLFDDMHLRLGRFDARAGRRRPSIGHAGENRSRGHLHDFRPK